jgi:hypothetical protein
MSPLASSANEVSGRSARFLCDELPRRRLVRRAGSRRRTYSAEGGLASRFGSVAILAMAVVGATNGSAL